MKVLIISYECWRDDSNGGNVLSNLFDGMNNIEFAQVYCKGGLPQNNVCKKYYYMNDKMAFDALCKHKKSFGKKLDYKDFPDNKPISKNERSEKFYDFFRHYDFSIFFLLRELLWKLSPWNNDNLKQFILKFNPDIIFAPCYGNLHMLRLDCWIKEILDIPMLSYISDDNYSFQQFRIDPFFWIYRFMIHFSIKKTVKNYNLLYTMTQQQAYELSKKLNVKMQILRKGVNIKDFFVPKHENYCLKFIYAGGIYVGRDAILYKIACILKKLEKEGLKYSLDIYTNSKIKKKYYKMLNNGLNNTVHGPVSAKELKKLYLHSDIALHVESFKKKYAYQTRLSFSTKIVDCLESGCAIFAVCPKMNSGWQYLKEQNAAMCVDDIKKLESSLRKITESKLLRTKLRENSSNCLVINHDINKIQSSLYKDFNQAISHQYQE